MPAKHALKQYVENGYYHIYNRGVAKNDVFIDSQDYVVFLSYLKEYLSPQIIPTPEELALMAYKYLPKNYFQKIELKAYCLMPNHFHFLVKQKDKDTIELFMRSLLTRYVKYFNQRHERVGHLFQDVYKGIMIQNEEYFLWLTRYIHRNPIELLNNKPLSSYTLSSYPSFIGTNKVSWLNFNEINLNNYREFVEGKQNQLEPEFLNDYTFEKESP